MYRGKTAISREEQIFMREAERLFRKENISPPKFQHLDVNTSLEEVPRLSEFNRFKDLDTIEEASTPLSSNTNILFSTHEEIRLPNQRETAHQTNPVTQDLTTILSSDNRMIYNSKPAFTLSTGANFSPREIQTPQEYDRALVQKKGDRFEEEKLEEFIEDKSGPLGFTFSNKKINQLKKEDVTQEDQIPLEPMQNLDTLPVNNLESTELENLVELEDNMKESDISETLDYRCKAGKYFTYAGPVLIALNPRDPVLKNDFFSPFKLHEYGYQNKKEGSLKPHLYSVTLSAYSAMLTENKSQVITLLGEKGTGKSQLMRYALEHLFRVNNKASRDMIAARLQETTAALDVMTIMTGHTIVQKKGIFTYDTAAFVIKTLYQDQGVPLGCQLSCKLLDCTIPKAKFARSFDALHALFHTPSKKMLQNLGISHLDPSHLKLFYGACTAEDQKVITSADKPLRQHDSNQWKRLIECFDILEFTQEEIYCVLDVLAIIILISEQKVSVRTQAPVKQWKQVQATVHKGGVFNKLQKLLGMSESKFNEFFIQKNQKDLLRQLRTLQRHLYYILIEYLEDKLNTKLAARFDSSGQQCLEIALLNFPGFKHRGQNNLGGFVSNMAGESLNFYCSQQFMKMIDQLNQEALGVKCLRAPLSKDAVEFLLQSEIGLIYRLERMSKQSLIAYLRKEEERQEQLNSEDEQDGSLRRGKLFHLAADGDTLTVRYTFGNATYSLNKLRNNIADFNKFSRAIFQAVKNHSKHPIFKSMQKYLQSQLNSFTIFNSPPASLNDSRSSFASNRSKTTVSSYIFSSTIADQLSPLLNNYLGCTPFIIYCFHTLNSLPSVNYTPFIEQPSFLQVDVTDISSLVEAQHSPQKFSTRMRGMPKCIVARAIRNTLIHPILIWECYGFPDWIALQEFSSDFAHLLLLTRRQNVSQNMFSTLSPRERAYAILTCFAEPLHFMVGSQHVLLKPGLLSHLQTLIRNQKKAYAMRFQALPGHPRDYVEALRRMISQDYGKVFSPLNYSWNPFEYDLELNQEPLNSVAKVAQRIESQRKKSKQEYLSSFETVGSKITPPMASQKPSQGIISNSGYSSLNYISGALTPKRTKKDQKQKFPGYRECGKSPKNKSPRKKKEDLPMDSENSSGTIKELMLSTLQHKEIRKIVSQVVDTPDYLKKYVDYSRKMSEIVKIQSWFRGTLVRKRKRWLDFAHYCASTIQRHWKGFKQRKFYLFIQLRKYAAIAIQRKYRLHFYRRVKAVRKIQHFFLKFLEKKILPLQNQHLDAEIARYEKMTKDVLGDVLHTEKAKRTHYINSLSPSKKNRIQARMAAQDIEGIDKEIAKEITEQKNESKALHAFKPTINEKSRKIVQKKRKQLERSGRLMERELFRNTFQRSSSTTSNNKSDRSFSRNKIHLIPTTIDVGEGLSRNQGVKGAPTAPSQISPKNEKLLLEFVPPRELDALGRTESVSGLEGGRERSLGDRLRQKLIEKQEEEKVERKKKSKKSDFNGFLMRQEQMEQKRKSRVVMKKQQDQSELRECSWSPVISRNAKKLNRNYKDLSRWNMKKEKQLDQKRKERMKEKELKILDFKASKNSEKILERAERRFASQIDSSKPPSSVSMLTQRQLPIWPLKPQQEDKNQMSLKRVFVEGESEKFQSSSFMVVQMSDAGISADSELLRIEGLLK